LTREDHISFAHALSKGAGSATAFCLAITVIWPVAALLMYHVRVSHADNSALTEKILTSRV
jgi:palmitoyltransferase ZDHHC9/14/18